MFEILSFISAIIISIIIVKNIVPYFEEFFDYFIGAFLYCILFILFMMISCGIGWSIQSTFMGTTSWKQSVNIVSLKTNNTTEGHFSLGCGSFSGVEYYVYFRDLGNNKYTREKVLVDKTVIIEDDNEISRLEWINVVGNVNKFITAKYIDNNNDYVFYVPKNTIIKQFKLQ